MSVLKRLGGVVAVAGLAAVGPAMPHDANAWWSGGVGVGIWVPPVVVAPPVYRATAGRLLSPAAALLSPAAPRVGAAALGRPLLGARPLGISTMAGVARPLRWQETTPGGRSSRRVKNHADGWPLVRRRRGLRRTGSSLCNRVRRTYRTCSGHTE